MNEVPGYAAIIAVVVIVIFLIAGCKAHAGDRTPDLASFKSAGIR